MTVIKSHDKLNVQENLNKSLGKSWSTNFCLVIRHINRQQNS